MLLLKEWRICTNPNFFFHSNNPDNILCFSITNYLSKLIILSYGNGNENHQKI